MRRPRLLRRGQTALYHCLSRTVAGQFLFGAREKEAFRHRLWKLAAFCQVRVLNYTVLSNHFHLAVRVPAQVRLSDPQLRKALRRYYGPKAPPTLEFQRALRQPDSPLCQKRRAAYLARMGDLSVFMKELKEGFSKWFNGVHERYGTLWAERFKSLVKADDPWVLTLLSAYLDLNAFRAGLTDDPKHYRFCGYGEALGRAGPARAGLASFLEGRNWAEQLAGYRQLLYGLGSQGSKAGQRRLEAERVWEVYKAGGRLSVAEVLRLKVRYFGEGIALGSEEFVSEVFRQWRPEAGGEGRPRAWPMEGAEWGGLTTLRKFKRPLALPKPQGVVP